MNDDARITPRAAAEHAARASYGRLLARLAVRWRDVAAAEDALAEAFVAALERWPDDGVPQSPEAWLCTVAQRRLSDRARAQRVHSREDLVDRLRETFDGDSFDDSFGDDRLRLMLVCAHPSIDPSVQPALILQTVLGLEVRQMAGAFLLSTDTLNKRLVRAKAKIKANNLRFEQPDADELAPRLQALLEAIYAAYSIGREGALADGDVNDRLRGEAVYLSGVVASSLPESAEALGFQSMLLFCEARRGAQVDDAGEFVPLLEQDPRRWSHALMTSAYELLFRASSLGDVGPFQLEAAIQGAHCYRARSGRTPWGEIAALYKTLVERHPTIGARVGLAIAVAYAEDRPASGLAILGAIDPRRVQEHQPYWVALGHLQARAQQTELAAASLRRALGLTSHPRLQRYLGAQLARLRPRVE